MRALHSFIQQISFVTYNVLWVLFQTLGLYGMPRGPRFLPSHSASEPAEGISGSLALTYPTFPFPTARPCSWNLPFTIFSHCISHVLPKLASNPVHALSWWPFHRLEKRKQSLLISKEHNQDDLALWEDTEPVGQTGLRAELQGPDLSSKALLALTKRTLHCICTSLIFQE